MSATYTDFGIKAADDILTSPRLTWAKRMPPVADRPTISRLETEAGCGGSDNAAALGAPDWLCLAAAPTFAIMALLTGVLSPSHMLCSAAHDASPLSGMIPMVLAHECLPFSTLAKADF